MGPPERSGGLLLFGNAPMHRVFIAAGDMDRLDYWLHHPRSKADLAAMGEALAEGARVILCGPDGDERPAELRFQVEVNCWVAYPVRARAGSEQ